MYGLGIPRRWSAKTRNGMPLFGAPHDGSWEWQQISEKQRKAFKKAAKSKKTVMFAGREYGISKQNLSDVWDDFEDAMELKAFPCLSSLFLTKWHKNLYDSGLTKTSTALPRLSSKRTIL
ncbi:putative type II DNA modification methylase [Neisseria meningitidis]|nr:putative type II DNA modification methylase [Neisseria meningitidis]